MDHSVWLRELHLSSRKMTTLVYVCAHACKAESQAAAKEITTRNEEKKIITTTGIKYGKGLPRGCEYLPLLVLKARLYEALLCLTRF